jgi:nicotinate-nucleotide adenylyltransferase
MGAVRMAVDLAARYGVDPEKARLAALLHDCAKVGKAEQLRLAETLGVDVSEYLKISVSIIHGPVGAELARQTYGVTDPEVLDAIRYHTLTRVGMTALEKLVYLADKIEYTRDYEELPALRAAAERGLDEGVLACMEAGLREITEEKNAKLHPALLEAMAHIKKHLNGR